MMNAPTNRAMHGEDQQERVEEAHAVLDVALVLRGDLRAGEHLDVGGQHRRRSIAVTVSCETPVRRDDTDRVELAGRGDVASARPSSVNSTADAPPARSASPNVAMPTMVNGLRADLGQHGGRVADGEVGGLGGLPGR